MMLLILNLLWAALASAKCYEPNTAHLPPDYDPNDPLLQNAFARISTALTTAVAAPEFAATSFSVEVTSSKESLWSQHHTARERNTSRPDIPQVNGDALYRIASITKSFTVLAILYQHAAGNLSLDDSIDSYIEELRGEQEGSIPWKDITLRTLASQLSGIPRDWAKSDFINLSEGDDFPYTPEEVGFPPVSRDGLLQCDEYGHNYEPPCLKADLMKVVKSKPPVVAPKQTSTYSNIAFELLGLAIENVTNQTYESYITEAIFKPLDMTKSSLSQPPDSAGVIPLKPQYWDVNVGIQAPTGGIYSSSTDLCKYLRYILTHYNGIASALNWMHPASPSIGLHSFYGTPWEIFRTDKILTKSKRTVSFITKAGGLPGYTSIIITVPEYDLGITILLAGKPDFFNKIQEVVTVEAVRAAEEVAIRQLQERYAGAYTSNTPNLNSSLTLVADHRGLVVKEWISNSTSLLDTLFPFFVGAQNDQPWYAQVIPTLLYRNESKQEGERWRLLIANERTEGDLGIWDDFCMANIDGPRYADLPINEIVFWKGEGDVVQGVELPGFRANLIRQKQSIIATIADEEQDVLEL